MSRVGKKPITVPDKVKVRLEGRTIHVEGQKGKLEFEIPAGINVSVSGNTIVAERKDDELTSRALHGMVRARINNLVLGVSEGYSKILDIVGVGYKAEAKGHEIVLSLGLSHQVNFEIPKGIDIKIDKQARITITGCDKQLVGETAARIRRVRPPEPYKGKGVRYADEVVKHKVGKAAIAAGA